MKDLGVRLLILVVAATTLGTLFMFVSGYLVTEASGQRYEAVVVVLFVVLAVVLIGIWEGFDWVRRER